MRLKVGDMPEFYNATLNELTKNKKNTPTMGGIMIIGAIVINTLLFADVMNFYVRMAMFCMVYLAVLGGVDDWLKLTQGRRTPGSREGLFAWEKMLFQVGLGILLAIFIYYHGATPPLEGGGNVQLPVSAHELNWPFFRDLAMPQWLFCVLTVITITGSSNAVNLTDGMDGLASGCMVIVAVAFMALTYATGVKEVADATALSSHTQHGGPGGGVRGDRGGVSGFLVVQLQSGAGVHGDTGSLALGA